MSANSLGVSVESRARFTAANHIRSPISVLVFVSVGSRAWFSVAGIVMGFLPGHYNMWR